MTRKKKKPVANEVGFENEKGDVGERLVGAELVVVVLLVCLRVRAARRHQRTIFSIFLLPL
jgi:hypothetical protein